MPAPYPSGITPFEVAVVDRMILDVHREPLRPGIERRPFGHGPRQQHAAVLEAEVVMQMAREMFLHAEKQLRLFRFLLVAARASWFRRLGEVALLSIFLESHVYPAELAMPTEFLKP